MASSVRSPFPGVFVDTHEVTVVELVVETGDTRAGDARWAVDVEGEMFSMAFGRRVEDGRLAFWHALAHKREWLLAKMPLGGKRQIFVLTKAEGANHREGRWYMT